MSPTFVHKTELRPVEWENRFANSIRVVSLLRVEPFPEQPEPRGEPYLVGLELANGVRGLTGLLNTLN